MNTKNLEFLAAYLGQLLDVANQITGRLSSLAKAIKSAHVTLMLALTRMDSQNARISVFEEKELFVSSPYQANFTKCSLIVPESRIIAGLLLQGIEGSDWDKQVRDLNVLQSVQPKLPILTPLWHVHACKRWGRIYGSSYAMAVLL